MLFFKNHIWLFAYYKSFCVFSLILRLDNSCEVGQACRIILRFTSTTSPSPVLWTSIWILRRLWSSHSSSHFRSNRQTWLCFSDGLKCKAFLIKLIVGSGWGNPEPVYINTAVGSGWRTSHDAQSSSPPHPAFICHYCTLPAFVFPLLRLYFVLFVVLDISMLLVAPL